MRPNAPSFSTRQRWFISLNVVVSGVAVFGLVGMVNYLAAHYFKRFYWSAKADYELSTFTRQALRSVTNEVKVIVFFNKSDQPLYNHVTALLDEYRFASRYIQVEKVDYLHGEPAVAERIRDKYQLTFKEAKNLVIFDCNGRKKIVLQTELSDYDIQSVLNGTEKEFKRTTFKGELLFTSAILGVVESRPPKAYFLTGHRECDPASDAPQFGYLKLAALLEQHNVLHDRLALTGTNEVPGDCALLILAGPKDRLLEHEMEKISKHLHQGGRLLALASTAFETGLEKLLVPWGVEVGANVVVDEKNMDNGLLVATNFTAHAIAAPLHDSRLYLILPRSVDKRVAGSQAADAATVQELILTGEQGQAIADLRDRVPRPSFRDRRGAIPLAVAVEKGSIRGVTANRGATRIVVVGESRLFENQLLDAVGGNYDFAAKCVNWLLERPQLMAGIQPKPVREYQLIMTQAQKTVVRWILIAGMPGTVMAVGLLVWWRRRH